MEDDGAMNLMRFTIVDRSQTVSFVYDGAVLNALLRACAEGVTSIDAFLATTARHHPQLREYVSCGLAVFDEHNVPPHYAAIHAAIRHFPSEEWPVFRVVDEATREASLQATRTGVIVFNLNERRIVQIQNSYAEILDMSQWVRRLQRAGWRIVP
jgi:hypothetical protein